MIYTILIIAHNTDRCFDHNAGYITSEQRLVFHKGKYRHFTNHSNVSSFCYLWVYNGGSSVSNKDFLVNTLFLFLYYCFSLPSFFKNASADFDESIRSHVRTNILRILSNTFLAVTSGPKISKI